MWQYNDELSHHGVKGMKWGVRRTRPNTGQSTVRRKSKKQIQKEAISKMSDQELRNRINRIQMERQYMQLTSAEISPGKKFVKDVITNAARQTVTNYTAKYMAKGMDSVMKSINK